MTGITSLKGQDVLITGACGTVGSELTRQVAAMGAERIICLDNNETDLFFLQQANGNAECYLADIRDLDTLKQRMRGVDVVLHSAALKHVGLCEESPDQAILTNINGTQNIIAAALECGVARVIFTSSDKAVNPTNVMGTSKLMGERLMTAASQSYHDARTIFASTRFGNVVGSRGSVVPIFRKQIESGGPLTLTDRDMTRFIMTLQEAAHLVLRSSLICTGGEVFVTKMPVARIEDIAEVMIHRLAGGRDIEIREIGAKPGEKMYEELLNDEEVRRTYELDDFLVVLPATVADPVLCYPTITKRQKVNRPYNSALENSMSYSEVDAYFKGRGVI